MFEVEKGIPIPEITRGARSKYPWKSLEVGDSFFVPERSTNQLCGVVSWARKSTGFRFTSKSVQEGGVKGARIWRVE